MVTCDPIPDREAPLVRLTRPPHTPGLELAQYPSLTHGWRSVPESYTCFTMVDALEGSVDVISRGVQAPCEAGSLTVGQPGEPHVLRQRSPMLGKFRILRVYNDLLDSLREEIGAGGAGSPFPRGPQSDPSLGLAFARLHLAIAIGERLETEECLLAFLASLAVRGRRSHAANGRRDVRGVRRARELLQARFDASVSLDELARSTGTDKFALIRAFARELGTTPHGYQVQLRMVQACRLIAQGMPLAEVAHAVGYSQQSALHRPFKRHVGITPGQYARVVRWLDARPTESRPAG
jgi:AraC-like DNA-binding protein